MKRNTKIVDGIQYNQCTKCGEWFPATTEYFYYMNKTKHILTTACITCTCMYKKEYSKEHREELSAKKREEYHKNPEKYIKRVQNHYKKNRAKKLAYEKERQNKNKETIRRKQKIYREENKEKIKVRRHKQYEANAEKIKTAQRIYVDKNREMVNQKQRVLKNSFVQFVSYAHQLTIDENPKLGDNGILLVKCTYCGRYFPPLLKDVTKRLEALKGKSTGELRLYCSKNCKASCPTYKQVKYHRGQKYYTNREVDPLLRQMALELDNYECQRCGRSIDEVSLHVHHILPYRKNPMMGNDIDNTLTLCIDCHLSWMHSKDGYGCVDTKCIS